MLQAADVTRVSWLCVHFIPAQLGSAIRRQLTTEDVRVVEVDGNAIASDTDLFTALAGALRFPDYFGKNWDALDECLQDLEWLPARGYVLFFESADPLWHRAYGTAGALVEAWLFAAGKWAQRDVPFHLVFLGD